MPEHEQNDLVIRPAVPDDARGVREIYGPIIEHTAISFEMDVPSEDELRARIERTTQTHPWFACEIDGRFAGYAYATTFRAREAYRQTAETSVYVADWARGRGVASALMTELLDELTRRGFRIAVAGATLPNEASARTHESLGFVPAGVFPKVGRKFDAWHDVGFWTLDLTER